MSAAVSVCVVTLVVVMLTSVRGQGVPDDSRVLALQAEAAVGYHPRNIHWRSNAAGQQAVWLQRDGDSLQLALCLPRPDTLHVTSVRFSSDGWMKEGAVVVDDVEVGTFSTVVNSNYGFSWNTFNTSSGPFRPLSLAAGRHVISVVMKHSMDNDPWGIEIDELLVELGGSYTLQDLTCPPAVTPTPTPGDADTATSSTDGNTATTDRGPSTSTDSGTSTTTDSGPSTTTDSGPSTTTDSGPSTTTDSGPSTTDSGPSTTIDSGPSTTTDSGPSTTIDSGPSTTTDSGPSTTTESDPSTTIDSGPSTTTPDGIITAASSSKNDATTTSDFTSSSTASGTISTSTSTTSGRDTTAASTAPGSPQPPEEQFTFSSPAGGRVRVVKNSYYSCFRGHYRFDVYGSDATTFTLTVNRSHTQQEGKGVYGRWEGGGGKRRVVWRQRDLVVEAVRERGAKPMRLRAWQDGRPREVTASRLVLSHLSQPRVVLDQTSRCYFFTTQDPSKQTSLVLGPRDPTLDSPDSDLDEVEVMHDGEGRINVTMHSVRFGRRSVVFALQSRMTTVYITQRQQATPLAPPTPLCAVLLPCSHYGLQTEALIRADRTLPVRATDAWRTITGTDIHFNRPSCTQDCP